jgi:hypothetical protein
MTERSVFWATHLRAIDAEGISTRAYAAREGLAIQSLYQWRQKLGQTRRPLGADPSVGMGSGFVAVNVTGPLTSQSGAWMLRVGGLELELPAHPDPHWWVGLIVAMERRSL